MATFEVPRQYASDDEPTITVDIKLTGRTVEGRMTCEYVVTVGAWPIITGNDLCSGVGARVTREEMYRSLCGFLSAAGESLYFSGDESDYRNEYTESQREFLAANYERFSLVDIDA